MTAVYQVDSFTDKPFAGNPAGVCLLDKMGDGGWMQAVAREMNVSETAFVAPRSDGSYDLRWFTPMVEVDLCGHATLAAAHVLFEQNLARHSVIEFHTLSGLLTARMDDGWLELDFPAQPPEDRELDQQVIAALGVAPLYTGDNGTDYLVEVAEESQVRGLAPDMAKLAAATNRGVIVTAPGSDCDFVSRFFAPAIGIPEDPVTGSAHCCLGPFWQQRLGRDRMVARQLSDRGGLVRVTIAGHRVLLGGQAVTVLAGQLTGDAKNHP